MTKEFKKELSNQKTLTINKEFSDVLDLLSETTKEDCENEAMAYSIFDDITNLGDFYWETKKNIAPQFYNFYNFLQENKEICVVYLAGKALGLELVEVLKGE